MSPPNPGGPCVPRFADKEIELPVVEPYVGPLRLSPEVPACTVQYG